MDTKRVKWVIDSLFVKHGDVKLLDGGVNTGAGGAPGRGGSVLVERRGHRRHGALLLTPTSGRVVGWVPGAGIGVGEMFVHGAIHGPVEHVAECRFSENEFSYLRKKTFWSWLPLFHCWPRMCCASLNCFWGPTVYFMARAKMLNWLNC